MSSFRLIINPFAELDLQVAYEWYDLKKEGLGKEFLKEVDKTFNGILQNPDNSGQLRNKSEWLSSSVFLLEFFI